MSSLHVEKKGHFLNHILNYNRCAQFLVEYFQQAFTKMMVVGVISFYNITLALTFHFTRAAKAHILYEPRLLFLRQNELKVPKQSH